MDRSRPLHPPLPLAGEGRGEGFVQLSVGDRACGTAPHPLPLTHAVESQFTAVERAIRRDFRPPPPVLFLVITGPPSRPAPRYCVGRHGASGTDPVIALPAAAIFAAERKPSRRRSPSPTREGREEEARI